MPCSLFIYYCHSNYLSTSTFVSTFISASTSSLNLISIWYSFLVHHHVIILIYIFWLRICNLGRTNYFFIQLATMVHTTYLNELAILAISFISIQPSSSSPCFDSNIPQHWDSCDRRTFVPSSKKLKLVWSKLLNNQGQ